MAEWPTGAEVARWMGRPADWDTELHAQLVEVTEEATEAIRMRIDVDKLPDDDSCPPTIRRAIIMEAARLVSRSDSPGGSIAYGDQAATVQATDHDINQLLLHWRPDPDPT